MPNLIVLPQIQPISQENFEHELLDMFESRFGTLPPRVHAACDEWSKLRHTLSSESRRSRMRLQTLRDVIPKYISIVEGSLSRISPESGTFPWSFGKVNLGCELTLMYYVYGYETAMEGVEERRSDSSSIKRAVHALKLGSGIFSTGYERICSLFDIEGMSLSSNRVNYHDKSLQVAVLISRLMKTACEVCHAMAQECSWQKAVWDNLNDTLIARIAIETSSLYEAAYSTLSEYEDMQYEVSHARIVEDTGCLVNRTLVKCAHFYAVAQLRKSMVDAISSRELSQICRLNLAREKLRSRAVDKAIRGVPPLMSKDIQGLLNKINAEYVKAEHDYQVRKHYTQQDLQQLIASTDVEEIDHVTVAQPSMEFTKYPPCSIFSDGLSPSILFDAESLYQERCLHFFNEWVAREYQVLEGESSGFIERATHIALERQKDIHKESLERIKACVFQKQSTYTDGMNVSIVESLSIAHKNVEHTAQKAVALLDIINNYLPQYREQSLALDQCVEYSRRADILGNKLSHARQSDQYVAMRLSREWHALSIFDATSFEPSHCVQISLELLEDEIKKSKDRMKLIKESMNVNDMHERLLNLFETNRDHLWTLADTEEVIGKEVAIFEERATQKVYDDKEGQRKLVKEIGEKLDEEAGKYYVPALQSAHELSHHFREGLNFYKELLSLLKDLADSLRLPVR